MQLLNIFITNQYIHCFSPDLSQPESFEKLHSSDEALDSLEKLLSDLPVAKNTNINFILDQSFLTYHYFRFPQIKRAKIDNILEFELEDTLLSAVDDYSFDYNFRTNKELSITEIGVYAIRKETSQKLSQFCGDHQLEMRRILALNNILDIQFREEFHPDDHIFISLEENNAGIFVYQKGFLTGFSCTGFEMQSNSDSQPIKISSSHLDTINQKIAAIKLQANDNFGLSIHPAAPSIFQVNDQNRLELIASAKDVSSLKPVISKDLLGYLRPNKPDQVNLLKSNLLVFQEIKKNYRALAISVCIIAASFLVYAGSMIYQSIESTRHHEALKIEFNGSIKKYLKPGTKAANAVFVLADQVEKLRAEKEKSQKFAKRDYRVAELLTQISSLKKKITTLRLRKLLINDQSIRFEGNVNSISDFDFLKDQLDILFPPEGFKIMPKQKSRGDEAVRFSVTIHPKKP